MTEASPDLNLCIGVSVVDDHGVEIGIFNVDRCFIGAVDEQQIDVRWNKGVI